MTTEVRKNPSFLKRIFGKRKRSVLNARTKGEKVYRVLNPVAYLRVRFLVVV